MVSSQDPQDPQVIILGQGMTGLSTAYHLQSLGIKDVAIAGPGVSETASAQASGIITGGMIDNFTRVSHAHGLEFAHDLWKFGDNAYEYLLQFAHQHKIPNFHNRRIRLITSDQELVEAKQAVTEMKSVGIHATLNSGHHFPHLPLLNRVIAIQDEGPRAAYIEVNRLISVLNNRIKYRRLPPIVSVDASSQKSKTLSVIDSQGNEFHPEIVVFANHLSIGEFIPQLKSALVGVADQWIDIKTSPNGSILPVGLSYSANHSYEWGTPLAVDRWRLGGGRYLRPMAGIEATKASAEAKISQHLIAQFQKTLAIEGDIEITSEQGFLDCRPCDELPIIGPMYGDSRLVVSTGYMGNGLPMAFFAGHCIAKLIAKGHSDDLPRRLWPERLRSIESSD